MKKIVLILLFPLFSIGQTQIGADIDGEAADDGSGASVSLSGDGTTLAIGAPRNDGSGTDAGSVRIYKNVSGAWTQIGADIDGETVDDRSAFSVSLSSDGTVLAIGARYNDGSGIEAGSVRVYQNISGTWTQIGADIDGEAANDRSGFSVSLSADGSIVAISSYRNGTDSGSVRVYKNVSGVWTKVGSDIDGEDAGDNSGIGLSLSADGSIVAIGAPWNDGNGSKSGSVRVYKNVLGVWTKVGADIDGEAADSSGSSVSLSADGSIVAISAYLNDGNGVDSGSVRVYQNISDTWTKVGANIDGEAAGDYSGYSSVSLSDDGSILAIGAYRNGDFSGSVRLYQNISGIWEKIGIDIDGEAAGDQSGYSVSLSGDGTTLAIGAHGNDGNGTDSGHVRVYNLSAVLNSDSFVLAHFSIYPNPVSEVLTISLKESLILEKVNIYNSLGQLVKTENKDVIAVSSLAKGSYFFEVFTNKGKATKQILVQ